jgi:hypothetical protein
MLFFLQKTTYYIHMFFVYADNFNIKWTLFLTVLKIC